MSGTSGFLTFSGSVETEHCLKLVKNFSPTKLTKNLCSKSIMKKMHQRTLVDAVYWSWSRHGLNCKFLMNLVSNINVLCLKLLGSCCLLELTSSNALCKSRFNNLFPLPIHQNDWVPYFSTSLYKVSKHI